MGIAELVAEFMNSDAGKNYLQKALKNAMNSKDYLRLVMSDERMKYHKYKLDQGKPLTEADMHIFDEYINDTNNKQDNKPITDKYASNIQNYEYNYKPEAQAIDPNIDPNEIEIGPMAQDIEKVNPSAIVTTPEGVKTVDINKLALMNAGAIADLARDIKQIKEILNGR